MQLKGDVKHTLTNSLTKVDWLLACLFSSASSMHVKMHLDVPEMERCVRDKSPTEQGALRKTVAELIVDIMFAFLRSLSLEKRKITLFTCILRTYILYSTIKTQRFLF